MLKTLDIRLEKKKAALDLAAQLMRQARYEPTERNEGFLRWSLEKDSGHACEISFQVFRGLSQIGYIDISACECEERQAFREIIKAFQRELSFRGWIATRAFKIFHSTGIP